MKKLMQICILSCCGISSQMTGMDNTAVQRIEYKKNNLKDQNYAFNEVKASFEHRYHPVYYVKSIDLKEKTIMTYDETVWNISNDGVNVASKWSKDALIIITVNNSWFSSYKYCLKNINTRDSVLANLVSGPSAKNAVFIKSTNQGTIVLSNGSKWNFNSWNKDKKFKNWSEEQPILIGETGNSSPPYYILLNVNDKNYISVDLRK